MTVNDIEIGIQNESLEILTPAKCGGRRYNVVWLQQSYHQEEHNLQSSGINHLYCRSRNYYLDVCIRCM